MKKKLPLSYIIQLLLGAISLVLIFIQIFSKSLEWLMIASMTATFLVTSFNYLTAGKRNRAIFFLLVSIGLIVAYIMGAI